MQPDLRRNFASGVYYIGLLLLVASLPLSKFMMSVSQFMIAGAWVLHGDIVTKFKTFFTSRIALLLASVFLLHIIGLFYSTNIDYALKDIRIKLPLLVLPILLSSGPPVSMKGFKGILFALIGGTVVSTGISWLIYLHVIDRPYFNIRDICIFISHIRLALLCCLSVFAAIWLVLQHPGERKWYWLLLVIPWMIFFMLLIESLTGLIILLLTGAIIFTIYVFRNKGQLTRTVVLFLMVAIPALIFFYIKSINNKLMFREEVNVAQLDSLTPSGNPYEHHPDEPYVENGHYVFNYISNKELREQWNQRSKLPFDGRDEAGQELRQTLLRFLSSKGLRKDSAGVAALTDTEIKSIEFGIANVDYQHQFHIGKRIHQVLWELQQYRLTGNPSGHSVAQRIEYWKAAVGIISDHPLVGVGTGDVPDTFVLEYDKMNSLLDKRWRLRSHNQYLSIAVAFGILGLTWFLISLVYPFIRQFKKNDYIYISFSIISILSMLTEDTLETQAGVTFFALFTSIFLFINPQNWPVGGN